MRSIASRTLLAAALAALAIGATTAQAASLLPPVQKSGTVEYLIGGIGQDEARAIEGEAMHWPLTLVFAVKDKGRADFAADVKVLVRDAKRHTVLELTDGAPLLLVRLAPGHYNIEASFAGKTLQKNAFVRPGHPLRSVFLWPAGTGEPRS